MRRGFTLVELLVVLSVLALLVSLAMPRYFAYVDRSREAVLKHNLLVIRDRIDQFRADRARFPRDLQELVATRYLREVPIDPVTERSDTWILIPPAASGSDSAVADVRSGASGSGRDGLPYGSL